MDQFQNIDDLLASVLADDDVPEETPTPAPLPDAPEQEAAPEPEPEPLSPKAPEDEVVDEIEALIAEATEQVDPKEPEPEPDPEPPAVVTPSVTPVSNQVFSKGNGGEAIPIPTFTDEDIMDQIDIRNFGTLVTLRTKRWHGKIRDRKAAKAAADAATADQAAFEVQKHLLAGADSLLKAVHKAIDSARTAHYSLTLPWSVIGINETGKRAGARLLPNTLFMQYTAAVAEANAETESAIEAFEAEYPNLIQAAAKKLGSAFNATEYPDTATIREHFGLEFDFMPIPKGADFDGLQGQMADKLSESLNKRTRTMLENAMADAWTRLYETVQHAHAKLSNPDSVFHYTLVEKLRDQASMLTHLNVTGDPRIEEIRKQVEDRLTKHDVKDIRKDDALRKRLAGDAEVIFDKMKEFAQ